MSTYNFSPGPALNSHHSFVTWENAFSKEELDKIVALGDSLVPEKAIIGGLNSEDEYSEIRESKVSWISNNLESSWIYDRLAWIVRNLNAQFYNFDITGFNEDFQYTVYRAEDASHYTWHVDQTATVGQPPRKLSLVLQLSSPEEYEGGELEILNSRDADVVKKQKGLVSLFPSYVLHRVTPVTKGVRKSLVVWVTGPAFR